MAERPASMGTPHKPKPLDNDTIRAIVGSEVTSAVGYLDGTIARERSNALKYYRGERFGNEVDGRSAVVMSDVQDTVEWIMPSLMRIFLSGATACRFQPTGPEDEAEAEQKTDYANYVVFRENDGFRNFYMWFKDALIQKNGIMKVFWDEADQRERSRHTGLTFEELTYILESPTEGTIEVVEQREYEGEATGQVQPALDEMGQAVLDERGSPIMVEAPPPVLYDVTLERRYTEKKICTEPVPPEEFIISREARCMEHARMTGHRMRRTVSWGIERGFDRAQLISLSETGANFGLHNREYVERRFQEYEYPRTGSAIDEATREVVIVEAYMNIDVDGDGYAELVQVYVGGESHEILTRDGEPAITRVDGDQPFIDITPVIMPHVFFGRSMYDLVGDLQLINSTLLRQVLDNSYGANNNRLGVSNKVDLDDLLVNRPDGVTRVDTDNPDVAGHIAPLPVQPLGPHTFPIIEFMKTVGEQRTGVIRLNQGLDAETLDNTMGGQARLMQQANQRIELIARTFAETGVKKLFERVCRLSVDHQDKPKTVKLRNKWVEVDPRSWNTNFDVTAEVGLGYDTREQEAFAMERLLEKQLIAVQHQGGLEGPFVTYSKVYNTLDKYTTALGVKESDDHWEDPNSPAMQQVIQRLRAMAEMQAQQGDPAMALAQGQIQNDQHKTQIEGLKAQAEDEFKREKLASEERIKIAEINARMMETAAKIEADSEAAATKLRAEAEKEAQRLENDSFNREMDRQKDREIASADRQAKISRGEDGSLTGTVSTADVEAG